jgi:hypothetical protein
MYNAAMTVPGQRLDKHVPAEGNAINRRSVFSVGGAARVATQRCGKHISAAVNQHATIEEAVFSVRPAPRLYNEDLSQLECELSSPELAVGTIIEKKWQERN